MHYRFLDFLNGLALTDSHPTTSFFEVAPLGFCFYPTTRDNVHQWSNFSQVLLDSSLTFICAIELVVFEFVYLVSETKLRDGCGYFRLLAQRAEEVSTNLCRSYP